MTQSCPRCGLSVSPNLALCPSCLLNDDSEDPEVPANPQGLELIAEIGRGGMGRVFRARQVKLGRDVAVKFLPAELALDPAFEARLEREAKVLARLTHPNIVMVHDFGTSEDGASYLVMEYVAFGTLASRIPLDPAAALEIAIALTGGLSYAHQKNVVHRDIKPENVLFDEQGQPKLADFGIARLAEADASTALTSASIVLGTPEYMAPEARRGAPADPRMDVFALGVLLERMISGRTKDGAKPLPRAVEQIVRRATALDAEARYATAEELQQALCRARSEITTATAATAKTREYLPPDELSWQRAVALLFAAATSVSLYAILVSFTPRVIEAGEALPFVVFGATRLDDGRLATSARFETFAVLAAAGTWAIGLGAYGLLRRHWREVGLDIPSPERRLESTQPLLKMAVLLNAIYLFGLGLEYIGKEALRVYVPVLGGVLELIMVYLVWLAVLEALRRSRPLSKEPLLWVGLGLSLLPPALAFGRLIAGFDF